jgi:hypothetical protein
MFRKRIFQNRSSSEGILLLVLFVAFIFTTSLALVSVAQSTEVIEISTLVKQGVSDEIIINSIRNAHALYHLTSGEILTLRKNGVSQKVIECMVNRPANRATSTHPVLVADPVAALSATIPDPDR